MTTALALLAVIAICVAVVWLFPPRYGSLRGCTGRALQATMEREAERRRQTKKKTKA